MSYVLEYYTFLSDKVSRSEQTFNDILDATSAASRFNALPITSPERAGRFAHVRSIKI